jgi:TolA-binding protein
MSQHHANHEHAALRIAPRLIFGVLGMLCTTSSVARAQSATEANFAVKMQQLSDAITQTQKQLEQSQRELEQLRHQLTELQQQIAQTSAPQADTAAAAQLSAAVEQLRERQAIQETQIATHEQSKIESESKYPVKLGGLVLMTGFVNTRRMDDPVTPSIALEGGGSTGATLRQTVFGIDARGPHLFGARTHADLRVDFDGAAASSSNGTDSYAGGFVRLRTAHAALDWTNTRAFFSLDHPIVAPNTPTSLTAVALPALAWSGNLWTWNPQLGIAHDVPFSDAGRIRLQASLISVNNPAPIYGSTTATTAGVVTPTTAQMSRWPGAESRVAILDGTEDSGLQLGVGGLFAPHKTVGGTRFNSWAGTMDYRLPLPGRLELSGSGYAGQALGGLGGGAFKDYVFNFNPAVPFSYSFRTLHDFGGWVQLKERVNERLEFNAAFGTDQVPASQLRPYAGPETSYYLNLARNRTYTGNVIYKPSAYLMFSMEYRHIQSSPVNEYTSAGDVIGIATGYRF